MSIFAITMVQLFILVIGFVISYFLNKSNLKFWRLLSGLFVSFIGSWLAGIVIWILTTISYDPNADLQLVTMDGISRTFLFAIIGATAGAYHGRKKAKSQASKHTDKRY